MRNEDSFTAGALRAMRRAEVLAYRRRAARAEPIDLATALIEESESRAFIWLLEAGFDPERFRAISTEGDALEPLAEGADIDPEDVPPRSPELRIVISDAARHAKAYDRGGEAGTEHLLAALITEVSSVRRLFEHSGAAVDSLTKRFERTETVETTPIPLAQEIPPLELSEPGEATDLGRILDASSNRAREGLRVVEDYVRFALDDSMLTKRIKEARHRLAEALRALDPDLLVGSRDTRGDVGTHIMTVSEKVRENPRAVLAANFKRTSEALRSLEEYAKLVDPWISGRFEVLRYDVYTLEKLTMTATSSRRILDDSNLMVLVGGLPTLGDLTWVVGEALQGGAQVIQLREKNIPDREWLRRAREVRILTVQAKAVFIVNDRPDLARLAGADGVHVGQDDLKVRDVRRILGPNATIGLSTHDIRQLEQAVLDAASYLGVGPVFASKTKEFDAFAGLGFVREAAETSGLPWFAIGGIGLDNIDEVLDAGARRVAVGAGVVKAEFPRKAAAAIREKLDAARASA